VTVGEIKVDDVADQDFQNPNDASPFLELMQSTFCSYTTLISKRVLITIFNIWA